MRIPHASPLEKLSPLAHRHRTHPAAQPLAALRAAPPLLMLVAALAGGCSAKKPPPPPAAPSVFLTTDHYVGTPLTGPRAAALAPAAATGPDVIPGVSVVIVPLMEAPRQSGDLQPVGARATLLTATQGERAVMSSPRIASDSLIAEGDAAANLLAAARAGSLGPIPGAATLTGALPSDVTARFAVADRAGAAPPGRGIIVEVYAPTPATPATAPATPQTRPATAPAPAGPANAVRVELRVTDFAELPPPPSTQPVTPDDTSAKSKSKSKSSAAPAPVKPAPPAAKVLREENVLFDRPLDPAGRVRLALVVPFRFAGSASKAMLLYVEVSPGSNEPAHTEAVRQALADAARAASEASGRGGAMIGGAPAAADVRAGAYAVLARANDEPSQRAALLYLADRTDSPAAADVALVADAATLAALAQAIADAATKLDPALAAADPGWLVERTTLKLLSERLSAEALPPELTAILVRRAGDLARQPDALAELLKSATGTRDLDNRVEAENQIALEDSAPAARVRAYDYLASRGKAPAGYDPLAPSRERRAALDKARSAPPAAATAPATSLAR